MTSKDKKLHLLCYKKHHLDFDRGKHGKGWEKKVATARGPFGS